ncbi:MAG: hypothetical protein ACYS0G_02720 [Planctomycetota bacterium]|jgi:hypothetical protein
MTSPDTSRRRHLLQLGGAALAIVVVTAGSIGCGSEAPPPRAAAPLPPPRPAPAAPTVTPIDQLLAQLGIDERIRLPEDKAPSNNEERKAVLEFFDAFARGDATALGTMLSRLDRDELDELVRTGAWETTTGQINRVDVQTGRGPDGQPCALAIFYVADDFQPQLWYYTVDADDAVFDAVAAPPDIMDKLSGADWITAWFGLLEQELALADQPDEEFAAPQKDYSDTTRSESFSAGPDNPFRPSRTPGSPGKRPKPKGPKRRPPGPPR